MFAFIKVTLWLAFMVGNMKADVMITQQSAHLPPHPAHPFKNTASQQFKLLALPTHKQDKKYPLLSQFSRVGSRSTV